MDQQVIAYLKSKSLSVISNEDIATKMEVWQQWYKGCVDKFHKYKVYSGKKKLELERKTLNLPVKVCQRWADLLLNEKVEINASDEYTQAKLSHLLKQVNFKVRGNNLLETAFAMGGGFLIQYWDGEKTNQKYITQEYMYPITYDSGRLTEAAFASQKTIDGKTYVYLETHLKDKLTGAYVVDNALLKTNDLNSGDGGGLVEVDPSFYEEHGIIPKWETGSLTPLFQRIAPNIANRDDFNSPWGTSVYSGAVDIFASCDAIYDSFYKEFLLGKKRIFVTDGVANINYVKNGDKVEQVEVFDPNDEVFYRIPEMDEGTPPIQPVDMALRVGDHSTALQTQLNLLSQAVGFGSDGFKWDVGGVTTATQVISQNSEMFRTIKKHEAMLEDTLIDMARGLLYVEAEFGGDKQIKLDAEITVDFDDSIIEDTAEIKRQAMLELNVGLISMTEYYRQVYKLSNEQAEEYAQKMLAERVAEMQAIPVQEEPEPEV
jgi:A118 family predicted phage portal protein